MSFLGGGLPPPSDIPPEPPPVTTPDEKALGKSHAQGNMDAGWSGHFWAVFFSSLVEGLKIIIKALVAVFDEVLSFFVQFVTAAQGTNTQGFYDLTAAILNDLLGVEVAGSELAAAARSHGLIGGMKATGSDFFNVLLNEFLGHEPSVKGGPAGLPGTPGEQLTPDQGLAGTAAFLGFILSFAVRQGNLETISTALPESFRMFEGIRSYGELMAKNLGLGRLSRRVLTPILQETIIGPMQQKLNVQYRPKQMDPKQLAGAFIRDPSGQFPYRERLALLGYSEKDIDLLIEDTYTRVPLHDLYLLNSTGQMDDQDFARRVQSLGFSAGDVAIIRQAADLAVVQNADRAYAVKITQEFVIGELTEVDFTDAVAALRIPKLEADAITRNAVKLKQVRHKNLAIAFLKHAYLEAAIDLNEYLSHALALGYSQADVDILEQDLLIAQKAAADKLKAHAAKVTGKAKGTTSTPPATPAAP